MGKLIKNKKAVFISVIVCICVLIGCVFTVPSLKAKAVEYDEVNPEMTYAVIDSDVEVVYNVQQYTPYGKYTEKNGQYTLETDAYVEWDTRDDVYIGYRQYNIGSAKTDTLTVEADLTSFTAVGNGSKYFTASAGITIRGGLEANSPAILLHIRQGAIGVLCRRSKGAGTSYTASGATPTSVTGLKIEKTGNKYVCFYRLEGLGWISFKTVVMDWNGPFLGGFALHCSDPANPVTATFSGYKAKGSGEYIPDEDIEESTSSEVALPDWEDAPIPENCLMCETFTDTKLSERDGKTPDKTIWNDFKGTIDLEENGNRRKHNMMISGGATDYVGSNKWTDYSASMDFAVTPDTDPRDDDSFTFIVRHQAIETVGHMGYYLAFTSTYNASDDSVKCYVDVRRKYRSASKTSDILGKMEIPSYFDYKTHNIRVDVIDNTVKVYYDDELLTFTVNKVETQTLTDKSVIVPSRGGIGISSSDSMDIYFDNIIVTKLTDTVGGDYDNYIGGNWDQDIPEYAEEFSSQHKLSLY